MNIGEKISITTIVVNCILFIFKFLAGIIGCSNAMIADAIHSLSDILTTIAVIFGLRISSKEADKKHPYGHERFEAITSKILAIILLLTGLFIGYRAIDAIYMKTYDAPKSIAIYAAITSIVVKEWMYRYTIKGAKKINSTALEADAWHHRSDALSSIGGLVGILGAKFKFPILDPIASLVICVIILKVSIEIYLKAINALIDRAADSDIIRYIENEAKSIEEVKKINNLKTRLHGSRIYVDIEIELSEKFTFKEAYYIGETLHKNIEKLDSRIIHCNVKVMPLKEVFI
ncbi:cation diffusion facilitator family transporter [Hathewaya histolytica]|uniref:cation diffusion facilitator family transporter n=1 Tax=Hathewaya histolytica TaxID=1498 RepID=UPI003B681D56